jgi:hypothetical protein
MYLLAPPQVASLVSTTPVGVTMEQAVGPEGSAESVGATPFGYTY